MALQQIQVGAAKRSINPTPDMLPLENMVGNFDGLREGEELQVRAVVIDNGETRFLICAWELGFVPCSDTLRPLIEQTYGIRQEHMLLSGNHNHSSPFVTDRRVPATTDSRGSLSGILWENAVKWTDLVMEQSIAAIGDAIAALRPAKYGFGEGNSYINVNRDQYFDEGFEKGYWMQGINFEGCSDKTLGVIKFVDDDGRLIAAVLNYAMHSTTSFCTEDVDGKFKITCDAPGIACNFVEEYYGDGAVVLWQSGAAGNQNPYYVGIKAVYDNKGYMRYRRRLPGVAYEQGVVLGQQHGMDAIRILKRIDARKKKMRISAVDRILYFPGQTFPKDRDRRHHRLVVDNLQEWAGLIGPDDPMPEKELATMIPDDRQLPMKAQAIVLGDIAVFGVGCELYNEIGVLCKKASPLKNTIVTTHVGNPSLAYILDDDSVTHHVFQSYGDVRPGDNNRIMVEGMVSMFDEAMQK